MNRKTRKTIIICFFAVILALPACENGKLKKYSGVIYDAFDTTTSVTAYCESEASFSELMELVEAEMIRFHRLYDIYNSYSGLTNMKDVNSYGHDGPVKVPQEIIDILVFAKNACSLTDGNVNVAMGSVLKLWHDAREFSTEYPEKAYLPDTAELQAAAKHCSMEDVIVDEQQGTVFLADPALFIDLGAVAKGYAVERVAEMIESRGWNSVIINAGGNVRAIGAKEDGENWTVGVTNPNTELSEEYVGKVSVQNRAVVTSGGYQRYFTVDGRRYHHIINKTSLMPEDRFLSVTIIADDSGYADALSTAVFNMDFEEGRTLVERLENVGAMWIMEDGSQICSSVFSSCLEN